MNKDGKISNKELVEAAKLLGITITGKEAKDLIKSVDLNSKYESQSNRLKRGRVLFWYLYVKAILYKYISREPYFHPSFQCLVIFCNIHKDHQMNLV